MSLLFLACSYSSPPTLLEPSFKDLTRHSLSTDILLPVIGIAPFLFLLGSLQIVLFACTLIFQCLTALSFLDTGAHLSIGSLLVP